MWQRLVGQTSTRTTTIGKERACQAYQAEHGCYEPDGVWFNNNSNRPRRIEMKQSKAKRSGTGTARGSHKGPSVVALFQVS